MLVNPPKQLFTILQKHQHFNLMCFLFTVGSLYVLHGHFSFLSTSAAVKVMLNPECWNEELCGCPCNWHIFLSLGVYDKVSNQKNPISRSSWWNATTNAMMVWVNALFVIVWLDCRGNVPISTSVLPCLDLAFSSLTFHTHLRKCSLILRPLN